MASFSYADSIYAKSRYTDRSFDASERVDSSADFSLAMMDMNNCDFGIDHETSRSANDLMACYLGLDDSDARIYNAGFLERLVHDFPQYKHVIDATNPYDPKCVKDAYNMITNLQRKDRASRRISSDRGYISSGKTQARLVSVFCGSYDEQHMPRALTGNNASHEGSPVPETSFESSPLLSTDVLYHTDSDPEYDDRRSTKRFKRRSRGSSKPAFSSRTARIDNEHVPLLCFDDASSPESYSIDTPVLSPMTTSLNVKETEAEIPDILDFNSSLGTSKEMASTPGYNVISSELIVSSLGSEMGRFCHPIVGGYECSCGHRAGTMGDMTRHWQSKRHSEAAFGCKACGKVYTREDALKRHIRRNDECARKARRMSRSD